MWEPWSRLLLRFGRTLEVAVAESRPLVFPSLARPLFVGVSLVCSVHAGRHVTERPLFSQEHIVMLCKGCRNALRSSRVGGFVVGVGEIGLESM